MLTTNDKQTLVVIILAVIIVPTVFFTFRFEGLYLLVLILIPVFWAIRYMTFIKAKKSINWKICHAKIEKVKWVKGGSRYARKYFIQIIYSYQINGKIYKGDRYSFLPSISLRNQEDRNKYALGKYITVYYNPTKPSQSVEKPGAHEAFFNLFWIIITTVPLAFAVLYFVLTSNT